MRGMRDSSTRSTSGSGLRQGEGRVGPVKAACASVRNISILRQSVLCLNAERIQHTPRELVRSLGVPQDAGAPQDDVGCLLRAACANAHPFCTTPHARHPIPHAPRFSLHQSTHHTPCPAVHGPHAPRRLPSVPCSLPHAPLPHGLELSNPKPVGIPR